VSSLAVLLYCIRMVIDWVTHETIPPAETRRGKEPMGTVA
jgi:hypothetical protein